MILEALLSGTHNPSPLALMSKESKAPNDKASALEYVRKLGSLPYVYKVMVGGSRSPLRKKEPNEKSDWDLVVLSRESNLLIPNPRQSLVLHADVNCSTPEFEEEYNKTHVEVYPEDTYNLFI